MADFLPIDHKDSDPSYREAVRQVVERKVGEPLTPISDPSTFVGRWLRSFPGNRSVKAVFVEYLADGTLTTPDSGQGRPASGWRLRAGAYVEKTWCDPAPEYDIPDGTWNFETYHCATTPTGRVLLWNGDASLLMLLTPASPGR